MLNENVKKLLKENMWDLATCSASVPNVVPVAFKDVTDDGKLVVGDVFLDTTLRNLAANDGRIAISVYDAKTLEAIRSAARPSTLRTGRSWPRSRPWSSRCSRVRPRRRARSSSHRRPSSSRCRAPRTRKSCNRNFHHFVIAFSFCPEAGADVPCVSRPFLHTCISGETAVCCRQETAERSHFLCQNKSSASMTP